MLSRLIAHFQNKRAILAADKDDALTLLADPAVVGDFARRRWYYRSGTREELLFDSELGLTIQAVFDRRKRVVKVLVHSAL
jgi:outer membrane protein assembly factor BamE (lipoprotein component of BamABCDE complex)